MEDPFSLRCLIDGSFSFSCVHGIKSNPNKRYLDSEVWLAVEQLHNVCGNCGILSNSSIQSKENNNFFLPMKREFNLS